MLKSDQHHPLHDLAERLRQQTAADLTQAEIDETPGWPRIDAPPGEKLRFLTFWLGPPERAVEVRKPSHLPPPVDGIGIDQAVVQCFVDQSVESTEAVIEAIP